MNLRTLLARFPKDWYYYLLTLGIGLLVYSIILRAGVPSQLANIMIDNPPFIVIIMIGIFLYLSYSLSDWIGEVTSFSSTLILWAVQLSSGWATARNPSVFFSLGGLLPMSDASAYYQGARTLLEGGTLSLIASWRPLFSSVLGTILGLTQQNLQLTLTILVLINAICCFFLAREIQRHQGTAAAVITLLGIFLFHRYYIGTTMSENWGLALGTIGLTLLWRGAENQKINLCILGIFVLTLALNTRAGAFFVLPALVLWGTLIFRGSSRFSQPFLLGGVAVVLLGFMVNSIVFKVVGSPEAVSNGNFAYTFYGIVVGSSWAQVFYNYPQLENLSDAERVKMVYELAFEALRTHPFIWIKSFINSWQIFILNDFPFAFIREMKTNVSLQILSLFGLIQCYRQRREPTASLVLAAAAGIVASVPFVPPLDTFPVVRAYAATIPFFCLLPALGLKGIAQAQHWHYLLRIPQQKDQISGLLITAFSLIILTACGPLTTKVFSHTPQFTEITCPIGRDTLYFRYSPGSSLNLVSDEAINRTYVPILRISDFQRGIIPASETHLAGFVKQFLGLKPNTFVSNVINLKNGNIVGLIAYQSLLPEKKGIIGACGQSKTDFQITERKMVKFSGYDQMFWVESMTLVSP